jgi:pyrimidine operon attenuation protein/uracil phosphoribosyltransferase
LRAVGPTVDTIDGRSAEAEAEAGVGTMNDDAAGPSATIQIMDEEAVHRTVDRMAAEIVERDGGDVVLVGIHTRGVPLADRLAHRLKAITGTSPSVGRLDITLYRDDVGPWRPAHRQPVLKETVLPFSLDQKVIYLVDDVLFTGRTIRAALDTLIDYGRPRAVRLAVLVDRGHRELPIAADVVGKVLATTRNEDVRVGLRPTDDVDGVWIGREVSDDD